MADNQKPVTTPEPAMSFEEKALGFWYTAQENWKKNQTTWFVALAIVVCALSAWGFHAWKQREARVVSHRLYGKAIAYLDNDKFDSATAILNKVVADYSGPEAAKAALQLGRDQYAVRNWDGALAKYRRAKEDGAGYPLLDASGRRGIAACLIELGKYPEAEVELSGLLSSYQKLTGDPSARSREEEPQDVVPALFQAMWQLVLVREKLGKVDAAIPVAEKLIRLYPDVPESNSAKAWLALNGKVTEVR